MKTRILSATLFLLGTIIPLKAQIGESILLSDFTVKKGNQGVTVQDNSKIVDIVSPSGTKFIYQITENKIGEFSYTKYDEDCKFIQEQPIALPGIDSKTTYTRIKKINTFKGEIFIYYESHDKKITSTCFLQRYNKEMEPKGEPILLFTETTGSGMMTERFGFPLSYFETLYSGDSSKFCIHKELTNGTFKNKHTSHLYIVYDFKSAKIKKFTYDYYIPSGFQKDLGLMLTDEGQVGIFYKISRSKSENDNLQYEFRFLGDNIDTSAFRIPFEDIWIRSSNLVCKNNVISIVSTFRYRKNNYKPKELPEELHGVGVVQFDMRNLKQIKNVRIPFDKYFKDVDFLSFNDGAIRFYMYGVYSTIYDEDGNLNILLNAAKEYTVESNQYIGYSDFKKVDTKTRSGYIPVLFRLSSELEVKSHKMLNISSCDDFSYYSTDNFILAQRNKGVSLITLDDMSHPDDLQKFRCLGKDKNIHLTTYNFSNDGSVTRIHSGAIEVKNGIFIDIDGPIFLKETDRRLYFFSKERNGIAKDYILTCYKIP